MIPEISSCPHFIAPQSLPKWLPYRRAIAKLAKTENLTVITSAALIGCKALLPLLRYLLQTNPAIQTSSCLCADRALLASVSSNCKMCVEALIVGAGADPFMCMFDESALGSATATHMAAARGKIQALKAILRLDSGRRATSAVDASGLSPVHVAAACGQTKVVRLLVKHDPAALLVQVHRSQARTFPTNESCFYMNEYQNSGLDQLRPYGEKEYNALLSVCQPHRLSSTALHFAASNGCTQVVQEIMRLAYEAECGPSVRFFDGYRSEPRLWTSEMREKEIFPDTFPPRKRTPSMCNFANLQSMAFQKRESSKIVRDDLLFVEEEVVSFIVDLMDSVASRTERNSPEISFRQRNVIPREVIEAKNDFESTPLLVAACEGHQDTVQCLLRLGANVHAKGYELHSVLHYAAQNGYADIIEMLVREYGVFVDTDDEEGYTALHYASYCEQGCGAIERLIKLNANCNAKTFFEETPLNIAAIAAGKSECFKLLLEAGADPNIICCLDIPISTACTLAQGGHFDTLMYLLQFARDHEIALDLNHQFDGGNSILRESIGNRAEPSVIRALLDAGADPCKYTEFFSSPVTMAAECSGPEIIRMLLEAGGNANDVVANGWSSLHIAAENNLYAESLRLLIQHGALMDAPNVHDDSATAVHVAAKRADSNALRVLLEGGAWCNAKTINWRYTPLHFAIALKHYDVIKILLSYGADLYAQDYHGHAPLHRAADIGCARIVSWLLNAGCPVDMRSFTGATALHYASDKCGSNAVVHLLLSRGADVNSRNKFGSTPLHVAAKAGSKVTAESLIDSGADIHARDKLGDDPILAAAREGYLPVIILLMKFNARLDSLDAHGRNIFQIAASNGHTSIVKYFLQNEVDAITESNLGRSPFLLAAASEHGATVRLLLEYNDHALDAVAPKYAYSVHSRCTSSDELPGIDAAEKEARRRERHENICELDTSRICCPICRRLLRQSEDVRMLSCEHMFHDECVLAWFRSEHGSSQLACPLCRQLIYKTGEEIESDKGERGTGSGGSNSLQYW